MNRAEVCSLAVKILYTLHDVDSQSFIVKPSATLETRVFRAMNVGTIDIEPCIAQIRRNSPELVSICDTHADEYAVYSVDFSEESLPLQCHGKVSERSIIKATGRLCLSDAAASEYANEYIEVQFHVLPIRKPAEILAAKAEEEQQQLQMIQQQSESTDAQLVRQDMLIRPNFSPYAGDFLPMLPAQVQIPLSLSKQNESGLPSSPPVRARPTKIASEQTQSEMKLQQPPVMPPQGQQQLPPPSRSSSTGGNSGTVKTKNEPKRRKVSSPKDESASQCANCGVETASTWRRVEYPEGKKELLCNACGLYYKTKHVMRPALLWDKSRTRSDVSTNTATALNTASAASVASAVSAASAAAALPRVSISSKSRRPSKNSDRGKAARAAAVAAAANGSGAPNMTINEPLFNDQQFVFDCQMPSTPCGGFNGSMLWSHEHMARFLHSDDSIKLPDRLSDRLVDRPNGAMMVGGRDPHMMAGPAMNPIFNGLLMGHQQPMNPEHMSQQSSSGQSIIEKHPANNDFSASQLNQLNQLSQQLSPLKFLDLPKTPSRKGHTNFEHTMAPDSIQKLFDISTPDQVNGLMLPGSGSAGKWLSKMMNNTELEEFLRSPTPRKSRTADFAIFASSPPTSSSNMFSDISDWTTCPDEDPVKPPVLNLLREETNNSKSAVSAKLGNSLDTEKSRKAEASAV